MITEKLKTIMADSGCTLVIYEADRMANLYTDQSNQLDIVGLIIQPASIELVVKANAIHEHYNPMTLKVMQQVKPEDSAENNEVKLQALLNLCKKIIVRLINDASFKTITPFIADRILETEFDANVIGWTMPLDLYYLLNENREPCL